MMLRRWVLPAGLLASLLTPTPARATASWVPGRMDSTNVYGSWTWVETLIGSGEDARIGTPAYCRCGRTLTFRRDGTYEVVVSDIRGPRELSSGRFVVHRGPLGYRNPEDRSRIWLEFMETDPRIQPALQIQFAGRDTIVTSDGAGTPPVRRFTRSKGAGDSRGRIRAQMKRPPRLIGSPPNEYGTFPAETDSSYDTPPAPVLRARAVPGDFARDAGFSGDVLLHVLVQPDGRVALVKVVKGDQWLRGSAMDCAWKWRFRPARKNGHSVQAWTQVLITVPLDPKPVVRKD